MRLSSRAVLGLAVAVAAAVGGGSFAAARVQPGALHEVAQPPPGLPAQAPAIAGNLRTGRFLVAWLQAERIGFPTSRVGVSVRRVDGRGRPRGPVLGLTPAGTVAQDPMVAVRPGADEALVVWAEWVGGAHRTVGRRLDLTTGGSLGPRLEVPDSTPASLSGDRRGYDLGIVGSREGSREGRWLRLRRDATPVGRRLVAPAGARGRAPFLLLARSGRSGRLALITTTANEQRTATVLVLTRDGRELGRRMFAAARDVPVALEALPGRRGWLSVWSRQRGPDAELRLRRISSRGSVGRAVLLPGSEVGGENASLAVDRGRATALVTWVHRAGCLREVRGVRVDRRGRPGRRSVQVTDSGRRGCEDRDPFFAFSEALASAGQGRFLLSWESHVRGTDQRSVYARRLSLRG